MRKSKEVKRTASIIIKAEQKRAKGAITDDQAEKVIEQAISGLTSMEDLFEVDALVSEKLFAK